MLVELTASFVKELNSAIEEFTDEDLETIELITNKMRSIMKKCENSENNINIAISKIEDAQKTCSDVVYIRKDGDLRAIISRDVVKPNIRPVEKLNISCNCLFEPIGSFEDNKGYIIIETEESLLKLDLSLNNVVMGVYDHDYRSFDGFCCYIGLYLQSGHIYIIDTIKFRDYIPKLRLLTCEVKKIITSQYGVDRLIKDFGTFGCYQNFNVSDTNIIVDWRIRPLNEVFLNIICNDLINAVEKYNSNLITERHDPEAVNEIQEFRDYFNIPNSLIGLVEELIKLRSYLAKNNNESPQYIMTNTQLYQLLLNMPKSVNEVEHLLLRMSSVLRLHVGDFLIILNQKSKVFSIEDLKTKNVEENYQSVEEIEDTERHRCFSRSCDEEHVDTFDDGDLVISD